ncbi:MAG: sulfur carrier protein ThiS [Actinomycetota bacterium]|jgi:sulfur carrier protein|nr:sulfur carrier protein ThiS [Actinomycetota bacterium]
MRLTVNGAPVEVAASVTVADLVAERAPEHRRVAVARNGEVVTRGEWATTSLAEGDEVEVLVPTAGG